MNAKYTELTTFLDTDSRIEAYKFLSQELGLLIITPAQSSTLEDFILLIQSFENAGAENCIPVFRDGIITMHMILTEDFQVADL